MSIILLLRSQQAFPVELIPRASACIVRKHLELTDGRKEWTTKRNDVYNFE